VGVPASIALPFGAFERTLKDPCNAEAAAQIQSLQDNLVCSVPATLNPKYLVPCS
jgi:hypothetical protein